MFRVARPALYWSATLVKHFYPEEDKYMANAIKTLVIGDAMSLVLNAYMAERIRFARENALDHVATYQHKNAAVDTVAFMDVYAADKPNTNEEDIAAADKARAIVNWNPAIRPEMCLSWSKYDKFILISDTNSRCEPGERVITGLVLVRPSTGGNISRILVVVKQLIASNGNIYKTEHQVSRLKTIVDNTIEAPFGETERVYDEYVTSVESLDDEEMITASEIAEKI